MRGERVRLVLHAQGHVSLFHGLRKEYRPGTQVIHRSLIAIRITVEGERAGSPQEYTKQLNHFSSAKI